MYSNILTAKFPSKASELLQYNHVIHTASVTYHWENVYAYDREFRQHISRHPARSWVVILQQAWTMLLKDRLCSDNHFFQKGHHPGGKQKQERQGNLAEGSIWANVLLVFLANSIITVLFQNVENLDMEYTCADYRILFKTWKNHSKTRDDNKL